MQEALFKSSSARLGFLVTAAHWRDVEMDMCVHGKPCISDPLFDNKHSNLFFVCFRHVSDHFPAYRVGMLDQS